MVANKDSTPGSSFGGKNSKEKTSFFRLNASRICMETFNIKARIRSVNARGACAAGRIRYMRYGVYTRVGDRRPCLPAAARAGPITAKSSGGESPGLKAMASAVGGKISDFGMCHFRIRERELGRGEIRNSKSRIPKLNWPLTAMQNSRKGDSCQPRT